MRETMESGKTHEIPMTGKLALSLIGACCAVFSLSAATIVWDEVRVSREILENDGLMRLELHGVVITFR